MQEWQAIIRRFADKVKLRRGLEKALDQIEAERSAKASADAAALAKAAGIEVKSRPFAWLLLSKLLPL